MSAGMMKTERIHDGQPRTPFGMKSIVFIYLSAVFLFGCSERHGFRVVNESTNILNLFTISWERGEVRFPGITGGHPPPDYSRGVPYGDFGRDISMFPSVHMPTKSVLVTYLIPGLPPVTNTLSIVLSEKVLKTVRHSHSNFLFVVNADGTITSSVSPDPQQLDRENRRFQIPSQRSGNYDLTHPEGRGRTMEVTILVPDDRQKYGEMITGEQDFRAAAAELPFITKKVLVPYSRDLIRATAEAAARETPDQAGEGVTYLKVQDGTAYVLLPMDCAGWAGVSFARACSHPIVERSLLQFKNIQRVVWNYAPSAKARYGVPAINQ